ncbi:fluoride efflux transporter FluC [Arthrobacter russicus]|uniref:Fluoride-specific ion channel FluC n=1 Tax=Arthrobacter russicus TaxID=172040 RepID=A0ABU1J7X2_9MICC|nr:CrcB family protein [Arthrobacter russicus]MDR6268527.1 CrcB protein [Arthrobacter russicus]
MSRSPNRPPGSAWLSVALAGFAGTELRYGLGLLFPEGATAFPATTFSINVVGSLALGLLTGFWSVRPAAWWVRAALGPGLLGSFTTFSAVVYAVDQYARQGLTGLWVVYLLCSLIAGLAAAWLGLKGGSQWAARRKATS